MRVRSALTRKLFCLAKQENGAALAELAILVPFLVVMLAAVAEFGRYFQTYTTLAKSTRASARYLSNHTFDNAEQDKARNLVVCGKLNCAGGDELVQGINTSNVCIQYQFSGGSPRPETVTVSIPRAGGGGCGAPYDFAPIFDIGALLNSSFSLVLPISPSTTMYYMVED